ncbi:PIN domain-containing protein [Streptomyces hydrogenans]|uniref:PIN domain-containing protein n=1 Tax=Streptomyces hydrogenans TaxID=1873719 RepID=UPI0035E0F894
MDTNILWGVSLGDSTASLLQALAAADIHVAVPSVVLDELVSQRTLEYIAAHGAATSAMAQLKRQVPWGGVPDVGADERDRIREHWQNVYQQLVGVFEPSGEVFRTALFRESNVLAPCKTVGKGKTGARDAAIWLAAVEYARAYEDEMVYFVSSNTKDFGDGRSYPEPMKSDLEGIEDRFVHFTSLDEVVERFAKPAELNAGFLPALLAREEWVELAANELADQFPSHANAELDWANPGRVRCTLLGEDAGAGAVQAAVGWLSSPTLVFDGVSDMTVHSIGGQDWYMATARWFASGTALLAERRVISAAVALEARVLVPRNEEGAQGMSLLHINPPRPLTADELRRTPDTWTALEQRLAAQYPGFPATRKKLSSVPGLEGGSIADLISALAEIGSAYAARKKAT